MLPSLAPSAVHPQPAHIQRLLEVLSSTLRQVADRPSLMIVTGAGISTESGIPDYRSPGRPAYKPLQHNEFASQAAVRQRYWARSFAGYRKFSAAAPNSAHHAVSRLQSLLHAQGVTAHVITQNVDRLHHRAGCSPVLELHGTVHEVECQDCQHTYSRTWYQGRLDAHNPDWLESAMRQASARPDGDVELPQPAVDSFRIAPCERCGSSYQKPCVVWFGGNVPAKTVEAAKLIAERASAALVLGSTLSTFSAFRLVRAVAEKGKPVGIVNLGATRADALSTVVKVEASLAPTLEALLQALEGSASKSTKASTATGTGTGRGHVLGADATLGQGQDMRLGGDRISGVGGEGSRMQVMR